MNTRKTIALLTFLSLLFFSRLTNAQEVKPQQPTAPPQEVTPKEEFKPSVRFGTFIQAQAQLQQEQITAVQDDAGRTQHWGHQFQLRRARIYADGALAKDLTFFTQLEITGRLGSVNGGTGVKNTMVPSQQTNLGTSKTNAISFGLLDAYVVYKVMPELNVIGGLQNVAVWRYGGLQSGTRLMMVDAPSTSASPFDAAFTTFGARDLGVTLRGFVLDEKLEYRAGIYEGQSFTNNYSPVRTTVRLNYNFMDAEKGFLYQGTALGKGQFLSVGGGVDNQSGYFGFAVDFYIDQPVMDGASLTVSGAFGRYHGTGDMAGYFPTQQMLFAEAGLFFKDYNLQPVVKFEWNKFDANGSYYKAIGNAPFNAPYAAYTYTNDAGFANDLKSNMIIGAGINYWITGSYNSSLKLLWEGNMINRADLATQKSIEAKTVNTDPKKEKQFLSTVTLQWTWFIQ
ncbi:MAG: hypothetical protein HGB11_10755 [Chlorobiales bacterium]|nr:hypothetical protein [Chlorobiales bacterium]